MTSQRGSEEEEKKRLLEELPEKQQLLSRIVSNLHNHNAEHIIIGGFCVSQYDTERLPRDLDIWVSPKGDNPGRVLNALIDSGFNRFDLMIRASALWNDRDVVRLRHFENNIHVDVLTDVSGSEWFGGFENAYNNSQILTIESQEYRFLHIHHLTINKIASWDERREKDMNDARSLLAIDLKRTQEQDELKAFQNEVRELLDHGADRTREQMPDRGENVQQSVHEVDRRPTTDPSRGKMRDKDFGPEW